MTEAMPADQTADVLQNATRQTRIRHEPVSDAVQRAKEPSQLLLTFPVDKVTCAGFLDRYLTFEDEIDRLKAEIAKLEAEYTEDLPLRAVKTAMKIARARKKLAEHPRDPMPYASQSVIEEFVEQHLALLEASKKETADDAERQAQRSVPSMIGEGGPS